MSEKINLTKADLKAIREEDQAAEERKNKSNESFIAELVELVGRYPRIEAAIASNFVRRNNLYFVPRDNYREQETEMTATHSDLPAGTK